MTGVSLKEAGLFLVFFFVCFITVLSYPACYAKCGQTQAPVKADMTAELGRKVISQYLTIQMTKLQSR